MSVCQVVKCDKCHSEIDGGGFHLGVVRIQWNDDETIDEELAIGREETSHLCDGCVMALADHLPRSARDIILPGRREPLLL